MLIREAEAGDAAAILSIVLPTIRQGETYALDPDLSELDALNYWMGPGKETFVAEDKGTIVGTYYMRPNLPGGGRHVCNCGYMTSAAALGRGIARRMGEHSLDHARSRGYRAMQFNFVVSTNERAVRLWQRRPACGSIPASESGVCGRVRHVSDAPALKARRAAQ